jgi:hypothetical protein
VFRLAINQKCNDTLSASRGERQRYTRGDRFTEINQPTTFSERSLSPGRGVYPQKKSLIQIWQGENSESGGGIKTKSEKGENPSTNGGVKPKFELRVDPEAGEVCIPRPDEDKDSSWVV